MISLSSSPVFTGSTLCFLQEYYDKGEYVICEGEEGSTFYIIAQGKVQIQEQILKNTL